MDLRPFPNWTLNDYCRECAGMRDIRHFDAMAVDERALIIYDRNRFERDTSLGAGKGRWTGLGRRCVGILVDARFADMPFVWYTQKLSYCRRSRDAIDANVKVTAGDM